MSKLLEQINTEKVQRQVSDLMEIKYGFGLPERDRVKGSVPVYASSGLVGFHNESKVKKPSIIIGRKGNVGSLSYSEVESYPIDTVFYVDEVNQGFDLKYVYYLLQRINLPRYGGDSAVPGLSRDTVYSIEVETPKEATQKKIASILSAYDKKIENNNKIIKNLEAMAQTIFNEWFVNFRFPGYEKVKFVDSEMGEIPEGWEVKNVLDVIERIPSGKKYDNKSASPKGKVPILDQGASGFIGYHDDEPGVLASMDNPVVVFTNHTCYYRILTEPFSCIQNVLPCIGKNGYNTFFVYYLTKEKIKMSEYKGHWPEFEQQVFVIPTPEIATEFSEVAKVFIEKIVTCEKENVSLKSQRDQLLGKLI
jgi:type I restriction enzyme S subunit